MKTHYMNERQILDAIYDYNNDAIRTVPHQNQQFAISISHKDNDSASVNAVQETVSEGISSCVGMRRVCLYGGQDARLLVSPSIDGDDFVLLKQNTPSLEVVDICAMRIKVEGQGAKAVLQG